jgi:hypothetical protein
LQHFAEAVRAKPDFGQALYAGVIANLRLARWRDARSMLRRALRNDPGNPQLKRLKGGFIGYRVRHHLRKLLALVGHAGGRSSP